MSKIILLVNCFVLAIRRNQDETFEVDASAHIAAFVRTQEAVEDSAVSNAYVRTQEDVEDSGVSNAFVRTQEGVEVGMGSREDKFCEALAKLGQLNAGKGLPCFLAPGDPQVYMIPSCTVTKEGSQDLFVLKLQFEEYSRFQFQYQDTMTKRGELIVKPIHDGAGGLFREEIASMIGKETGAPDFKWVKHFIKGRRWGQMTFEPSSPGEQGVYRTFVSTDKDNGKGQIDYGYWFSEHGCEDEFNLGFHQWGDDKIIQLALYRRTTCQSKKVAEGNWEVPALYWGGGADGNLERRPTDQGEFAALD